MQVAMRDLGVRGGKRRGDAGRKGCADHEPIRENQTCHELQVGRRGNLFMSRWCPE